jgi:dTDP-4-dehydrorhamnose 3,5-epimerase
MKVIATELPGVLVIEPEIFTDERGFFLETYHERRYAKVGLPHRFVQDNHSRSAPGTLRGLHYQRLHPQGKLVRCVRGTIFDVAVDIRRGSPTFARWVGVELSEENKRQVYIPPGFAHGFCVPATVSEVEYKCTELYHPGDELGIRWDDPTLGIRWPVAQPLLSPKDAAYPLLTEQSLPTFSPAP